MKNSFKFQGVQFRFFINFVDITMYLDKIYADTENNIGYFNIAEKEILYYEKSEDKIILKSGDFTRNIDKEPIIFYNEKKELLFKIYDKSDSNIETDILNPICYEYNMYDENNNILKKEELLEKNKKTIILKLKNEEYNELFKPLFDKINTEVDNEIINTNIFLPYESNCLGFSKNTQFNLIIKQRKPLLEKINSYINDENIQSIKIFGADGIGKSISFLFFTTVEDDYKKIYFNLKDIYKDRYDIKDYFIKSLMKYYKCFNIEKAFNKAQEEKKMSFNYNLYKNEKLDFEEEEGEDFWFFLMKFCEKIKLNSNSIIIIDQYKQEYDNKSSLTNILKIYKGRNNIKFIISSSLNDNSVKENFISNLKFLSTDKGEIGVKETKKNEVNILFRGIDFGSKSENISKLNNGFSKILLFKDILKDNKNTTPTETTNNNIKKQITKNEPSSNIMNTTKIIYINDLISLENIIDDENEKSYFEIFNYNPKSYNKYKWFLLQNGYISNERSYQNFLGYLYFDINNKVDDFYKKLKDKNLPNKKVECLKGTYIIKLVDIINCKEVFNFQTLIQYLKIFPFKYLKIYLKKYNSVLTDTNNIIEINSDLNNKEFYLDYSNKFVKLAFLKIIYDIAYSTQIDMDELSDSGIGSLLENKIKRYIEENEDLNIKIRYVWNFTSKTVTTSDISVEDKYDFKSFTKREFDDNTSYKINDNNISYYIIPGSQTNRSLDSILLQPSVDNSFNMICFQITKHKKKVKQKSEYKDDCFLAKTKLEKIYGIKITNVYFYFILAKDCQNEDTKEILEAYNISYFYFSIRKQTFDKYGENINFNNLNISEAEINFIDLDNEYKTSENKNELICSLEKFLIKKRKRDKNFVISENNYEKARRFIFRKSTHVSLDDTTEKDLIKIVSSYGKFKRNFTFVYVFNIFYDEFGIFKKNDNLIGIIIDNTNKQKYYYYLRKLHPDNKYLDIKIQSKMISSSNRKDQERIYFRDKNYLLSEIPSKFCNSIFVFKIYECD